MTDTPPDAPQAPPPPPQQPAPPPQAQPPKKGGIGLLGGLGIGCFLSVLILFIALFALGQCVINMGDALEERAGADGGASNGYVPPAPSPNLIVRRQPASQEQRDLDLFLGRSLAVSESAWNRIFQAAGGEYRPAKVVIFDGQTVLTACGRVQVQTGPFYCPDDETIYIETGFFRALARAGGEGDFPVGLVLAHEVGHHVQKQTGLLALAAREIERAPPQMANRILMGVELQADCYAGLWGDEMNRGRHLDPGDIEEGLAASQAIGDDVLQSRMFGRVDPSRFTHGSAAQRAAWFMHGLRSQNVEACQPALYGGMPSSGTAKGL